MANFKELDNEDYSTEIKIMSKIHERDRKRLEELRDAYALAAEKLRKYREALNSALENQGDDKPE